MSEGLKQVAALPDPVGEILGMKRLENGLQVGQMRGPIGVIGIIYESRPNVTMSRRMLQASVSNPAMASFYVAALKPFIPIPPSQKFWKNRESL